MSMINDLLQEMVQYYSGDPKRIQHFLKVHTLARFIGKQEHVDSDTQIILEMSALVHDIGSKAALKKYGKCTGKLQEKEGPPLAREMLEGLQVPSEMIERICYLVANHHTYTTIKGMDYQILVEADFLVNLYEEHAEPSLIAGVYKKIFRTPTGRTMCRNMYGLVSKAQAKAAAQMQEEPSDIDDGQTLQKKRSVLKKKSGE